MRAIATTPSAGSAQSPVMGLSADDLFSQAFSIPRDPRSDEYKAGVLAVLKYRVDGAPIPHPYKSGSAQDDAYYSGQAEGHAIWRRALAGTHGSSGDAK